MRMNKFITILVVLSLALMGLNCKKSEEPEPVIPDRFIGTWEAKASIEGTSIYFAPVSNPAAAVPLHLLGAEVRVVLNKDGSYTLVFVDPTEGPDTDQGKVTIDEDLKIITMDNIDGEETLVFAYEWEDDILVLKTQIEFDFGEGDVPTIATISLKKTA